MGDAKIESPFTTPFMLIMPDFYYEQIRLLN